MSFRRGNSSRMRAIFSSYACCVNLTCTTRQPGVTYQIAHLRVLLPFPRCLLVTRAPARQATCRAAQPPTKVSTSRPHPLGPHHPTATVSPPRTPAHLTHVETPDASDSILLVDHRGRLPLRLAQHDVYEVLGGRHRRDLLEVVHNHLAADRGEVNSRGKFALAARDSCFQLKSPRQLNVFDLS